MNDDARLYLTELTPQSINNKNTIIGTDGANRVTILIRNPNSGNDYAVFQNDYLLLKNSVNLCIDNRTIGNFHILICKKTDDISISHFKRMCDYLFLKADVALSSDEMVKLFYSLERIFSESIVKNKDLEIGLYGELALINYLYLNNNKVFDKWHGNFFSKHDFEINNKTKLEVKSTVKENRIHSFSHDQIYRSNLNVYVVSCLLKTCENGYSLYELCKDTMNILTNNEQLLAIELLIKKLGLSDDYVGINCILDDVYNNIKLFSASDIPHLTCDIPDGVSNIHYDIDLSNIPSVSFDVLNGVV